MRLSSLFRRRAPVRFDSPLAPESRFAAVGDVHGRDDLLAQLISRLDSELAEPAPRIFVGDYIDRGEESAGVLRRLHALDAAPHVTCLAGNHEAMMLAFLDAPAAAGRHWLRNGGLQTLASFGVGGVPPGSDTAAWGALRDRLRAAMGEDLEAWLRARPLRWHSGNVAVVHAGADPALPLTEQSEDVLLWGHPRFAVAPRTDGTWIVHGHTIVDAPTAADGRIAVDTGAFATGRLTAAIVDAGDVRFVST